MNKAMTDHYVKDANTDWHFRRDTHPEVRRVIRQAHNVRKLLRFHFGEGGVDECREDRVCGYIGRSMGPQLRVPLLCQPLLDRVLGPADCGDAFDTHNVVKIVNCETGQLLWKHPKYVVPQLTLAEIDTSTDHRRDLRKHGYCYSLKNEFFSGNFKTLVAAQECQAFLQGFKLLPAEIPTREQFMKELNNG